MNIKPKFKIKQHQYPNGATAYRVTGMLDGKQIRNNHSTMGEAVTDRDNLERRAANLAPLPTVTTRLTSEQAAEAESVYRRIAGQPHSLTVLLDFALKNYSSPEKARKVADAFKEFIAGKLLQNPRDLTVSGLNQRLKKLVEAHGETLVAHVQPAQIQSIIFRDGSGNTNRSNDFRAHTNFFNWSVRQGYCAVSPMLRLPKITIDRNEPVILQLAEVRRLLAVASEFEGGRFIPYVGLGLFAGLRPVEMSRINWDVIKLASPKAAHVVIGSQVAKMRGRRVVAISENLCAFLQPHALAKTPIFPANWRKDFDRLKLAAGYGTADEQHPALMEWPVDVLRHTAISNHFAFHQHEGQSASWAGNSPDVIHKHYKGLITHEDAAEFWGIAPGTAKILQLKAA